MTINNKYIEQLVRSRNSITDVYLGLSKCLEASRAWFFDQAEFEVINDKYKTEYSVLNLSKCPTKDMLLPIIQIGTGIFYGLVLHPSVSVRAVDLRLRFMCTALSRMIEIPMEACESGSCVEFVVPKDTTPLTITEVDPAGRTFDICHAERLPRYAMLWESAARPFIFMREHMPIAYESIRVEIHTAYNWPVKVLDWMPLPIGVQARGIAPRTSELLDFWTECGLALHGDRINGTPLSIEYTVKEEEEHGFRNTIMGYRPPDLSRYSLAFTRNFTPPQGIVGNNGPRGTDGPAGPTRPASLRGFSGNGIVARNYSFQQSIADLIQTNSEGGHEYLPWQRTARTQSQVSNMSNNLYMETLNDLRSIAAVPLEGAWRNYAVTRNYDNTEGVEA